MFVKSSHQSPREKNPEIYLILAIGTLLLTTYGTLLEEYNFVVKDVIDFIDAFSNFVKCSLSRYSMPLGKQHFSTNRFTLDVIKAILG